MAIFHKDGKTYTLERPNPLVKQQETWDHSKLIFHNFNWEEIRSQSEKVRTPKIKPIEIVIKEEPNPVKEKEPERVKEPEPEVQIPDAPSDEREFDLPLLKYKVLSYCLPAKREKRADSLYGDTWEKIGYGQKFVFPSVVISSTDIAIEFWTSDPKKQITEGSVIYPFSYEVYNKNTDSYDKVPYDEYRWWKISSRERKEEGWLFSAMPSDIQPDFS